MKKISLSQEYSSEKTVKKIAEKMGFSEIILTTAKEGTFFTVKSRPEKRFAAYISMIDPQGKKKTVFIPFKFPPFEYLWRQLKLYYINQNKIDCNCSRCGGSGRVNFSYANGVCFQCQGSGKNLESLPPIYI